MSAHELQPLLLSALARLHRQGFACLPDEAHDLIQTFTLEVLPGLQERYDPTRGSFRTYAYGAFLRFSRPRIVRSRRLRNLVHENVGSLDFPASSPPEFSEEDLLAVRAALNSLDAQTRAVVELRFETALSEREAARRLDMSRYSFREATAEALGRLAVALQVPSIPPEDRSVLHALWVEQRPIADVASEHSTTPAAVRRIRQRVLSVFRDHLGARSKRQRVSHD